jgi:hypothetical protein
MSDTGIRQSGNRVGLAVALCLAVAAAYLYLAQPARGPETIDGYWEIPVDMPRDGRGHCFIAKIYDGEMYQTEAGDAIPSTGYVDLTAMYSDGGWYIRVDVGESMTESINAAFTDTEGSLHYTPFQKPNQFDAFFEGSWSGEPYQYYSKIHTYPVKYPSVPGIRRNWIQVIEVEDTGTALTLTVRVSGPCGEAVNGERGGDVSPVETYWHGGSAG